jgi:hypothetical protein
LDIEAEVTVWQVTGPLSWERPATARRRAAQETAIKRPHLDLGNLLPAVWTRLRARVVSHADAGA